MTQEPQIRYVRTVEERHDEELCIDLVDGAFAPSWDIRNVVYYSIGAPKLKPDAYITAYKRYLMGIWQHDEADTDSETGQLKQVLSKIKNGEFPKVCLATPSGAETPYSKIFNDFLNWVLTT